MLWKNKSKPEKKDGELLRSGAMISTTAGREGCLEEVAFEQKLEKDEYESQVNIWEKIVQKH